MENNKRGKIIIECWKHNTQDWCFEFAYVSNFPKDVVEMNRELRFIELGVIPGEWHLERIRGK